MDWYSDVEEDYFDFPCYGDTDFDYVDDDSEYDEDDIFGYGGYSDGTVSPPSSPPQRGLAEELRNVNTDSEENEPNALHQVPSLVDISSRFVALKFPFAYIEHRNPPVPDELQLKVISFSFPDNEEIVRKYAEFSRNSVDIEYASRLCKTGCVKDLTQIGFRLSATVEDKRCCGRDAGKNYVAIHFDRGKITSAQCTCTCNPQITWCNHVIATAFKRIRNKQDGGKVCIHLPVSDSLNLLSREQLLKFAQYLLCEHKNEPVVDSAQQLLDKLLQRGGSLDGEDNINAVAGAPDPTAGPGMDEDAQWFVSKEGLKGRFDYVIYQDLVDLGFENSGKAANDGPASFYLHGLWQKYSRSPACLKDFFTTSVGAVLERPAWLIEAVKNTSNPHKISQRDEIDAQIDLADYRGTGTQSDPKDNVRLLKIIPDLLRDDSNSAIAALQACTEWLLLRLKRGHNNYHQLNSDARQPDDELEMKVSLAGGFAPRPFSCGTLVYEVSRLWRIAVLDPKLSVKNRQEILEQLAKWDEEVMKLCHDGRLCVWQGLKVAVQLGRLYQQSAEAAAIIKRPCLTVPTVSSCMVVHYNVATDPPVMQEHVDRQNMGKVQISDDEEMLDVVEDVVASGSAPAIFYLPHCMSFGDNVTLDVHTVCSFVEALIVYNNSDKALRLAVALSASILSFYRGVIHAQIDPSELPMSAISFIGRKVSNGQHTLDDMSTVGECKESATLSASVWPKDTLLTVTMFAFLFDVLSKHLEDADAIVREMSLDWMKSSVSLKFQLGLVGLFVPKLPAPSKQQEVEQYEFESWLTSQLINTIPSDQDKQFLSSFGNQILSSSDLWHSAPPSSLARVIFQHLFLEAPATLDQVDFTTAQNLGLGVALHVLRYVNGIQDERSESWCFYHYSVCRLWSKLAEMVLRSLSDSKPLLDEAMRCILKQDGLLGRGAKPAKRDAQNRSLPSPRQKPLIEARCRVAYGLARAVGAKLGGSDSMFGNVSRICTGVALNNEPAGRPRKMMKTGSDQALNLCAIQLGAHNFWLQKIHQQVYMRVNGVSWLVDLILNSGKDGINCLLECKGGVTTVLHPQELFGLCIKILMDEQQVSDVVKRILTCILKDESSSPNDIKSTISFCGNQREAFKSVLVPWVCQLLQTSSFTNEVLFYGSLNASKAMFTFFKLKLRDEKERLSPPLRDSDAEEMEQNDEGHKAEGAEAVYATPDPHPYLEEAFELGLKALQSLDDNVTQDIVTNRLTEAQTSLREFCDVVNYIVLQKWKDNKTVVPPQQVDEEGTAGPSDAQKTPSNRYLSKFVSQLINSVKSPMWLFDVVKKLCIGLCSETVSKCLEASETFQERQDKQIKDACSRYPLLSLLLQKNITVFRNLLLGPKITKMVGEHALRPVYELSPEYQNLEGSSLKEVLAVAKRLCLISDSSSSSFDKLTRDIEAKHPVLKPVLKAARRREKKSRSRRFNAAANNLVRVSIVGSQRDGFEEFLFG